MISQAKAQGVELLFVTQPVLWDDDLGADAKRRLVVGRIFPAGREWDLLTPENLRKLMDRFNSKLQETCAEAHVECIDAASELSGDESLFLDDFHLNDAGCQRLAEVIAKHRQQP
jgi:lysophospholipase L1-like esterase